MSLRSRVLLGFVAIALVLLAADAVLAAYVQRSLIDQVDSRLREVGQIGVGPGPRPPASTGSTPSGSGAPRTTFPTPDDSSRVTEFYFAQLASDGSLLREFSPTLRDGDPLPALDPQVVTAHAVPSGQPPEPFTVGSQDGGALRYRLAVTEQSDGGFTVTGIPLREADATFTRLLWVEAAATGAVLVVLGLVAFWVIRLGIRPIDEMAVTANAIAEGDLSRRVDVASPRTEAGQLGIALNGMLHQIEGAFDERQASEDRLRRFVADASHELRTPLTSIRGYTELYRSGAIAAGPQLADAMRRIEGESERMGGLVDDMLLLARLDQGRPLEAEPVDLAVLAGDAVADLRAVEPARPIELAVADRPAVVLGDEQRLRQVVANLVTNARVHTPTGTPIEVRVEVRVEAHDDPEAGWAVLEVTDHGPGIPADDAAHIFERFYRGDPSRSRADGGSTGGAGLGLSIVAAVAQAHHGRASVESAPGAGSRFRVELPLAPTPSFGVENLR